MTNRHVVADKCWRRCLGTPKPWHGVVKGLPLPSQCSTYIGEECRLAGPVMIKLLGMNGLSHLQHRAARFPALHTYSYPPEANIGCREAHPIMIQLIIDSSSEIIRLAQPCFRGFVLLHCRSCQ